MGCHVYFRVEFFEPVFQKLLLLIAQFQIIMVKPSIILKLNNVSALIVVINIFINVVCKQIIITIFNIIINVIEVTVSVSIILILTL
jgi:hypothetical protein